MQVCKAAPAAVAAATSDKAVSQAIRQRIFISVLKIVVRGASRSAAKRVENRLNVEFTQHSGDEMFHPSLGGYSPEWSVDEA